MGIERYWTYQQFQLTDRLSLYVNLWNGNLVVQYNEFSIPSRGVPLTLNRTLNHRVNLTSTVGFNWTRNLDYHIVEDWGGALVYDSDGTQLSFGYLSPGVYQSPSGVFDTLSRAVDGSGVYTLTHKDQSQHIFGLNNNGTWILTQIKDRVGNTISLNYDGSYRLTGASTAGGQTLTFTNDASTGRLTSVADNASHAFNYQYDATTGDLKSITDPLGFTTSVTYTNHSPSIIADPRGVLANIYYDASNRVQIIAVGGVTIAAFSYNGAVTTFTDGNNHPTAYTINSTGQVTQKIDALNGITSYAYDANYDVTQIADALNRTSYAAYDTLGNLTVYTDTLNQKTSYTYNGTNDLLSVTDPLNRITRYGYDGIGNLTVITDALGFTTNYAYNSYGQRTSATDANNHTTRYGYNSAGFVITTTDPLNNLTQYGYDAVGNRTVTTDARNNVTTFAYDGNNRLLSSTSPLTSTQTAVTSYGYDGVSNRTVMTDAMGSVSRYGYDAFNHIISNTLPLTGTQTALWQYGYDAVGNRTVLTDANSNVTRYGYDAINRTIAITDALSNVTRYGYDAVSNRTVVTDAVGNATRFTYDNLDRVTTITNPLGKKQRYSYDAVGNTLVYTDEVTQTTRYAYNELNRVISTTNPLTQTTRYGYDKVGNTTTITGPTGLVTSMTYWETDWLKTKTTPIGTTQYAFDNVGNVLALTAPSSATQTFVYDKANRLAQEQDRDPGGNLIVTYVNAYDANGNRLSETEKRPGKPDRVTTYSYNKANWLVSNTDAGGGTTIYTYDAAGNRTSVSDALGVTTVITPTTMNSPGSISHYQSGAWKDTTTNTYDARNNLTNALTYIQSGFGNFTISTTTSYNGNDYLGTFGTGVNAASYSYNMSYTDNNLVKPMPATFDLVYDEANRVHCWKPSNVVGPEFWSYFADGNRHYHFYNYAWLYGCDAGDPGPTLYSYRDEYFYTGQKLTRLETRPWFPYDPGNSIFMTNTMSYDSAGNLTQQVITDSNQITTIKSYSWAWQGGAYRMTNFTASNGVTTTFDYDSSGRITRRYTSLGYSDYIYEDGSDWLLRETWHSAISGNAFDLVRYWYLNGRPIRMEYAYGPPSDLSSSGPYDTVYFQYNWHGDVAARVPMDGAGGATMGTTFGPWGDAIAADPVRWHYYRWNGGWGYLQFVDLGMYYVHGRWYRPDLGRFISPNEKGDYLYGGDGNDAVNFTWYTSDSAPGDQGSAEDINSGRWIIRWMQRNRSQVIATASRHNLLPEFLGAVLYLENSSAVESALESAADLLPPLTSGLNVKEDVSWEWNINPLSDSGSQAFVNIPKLIPALGGRDFRIFGRTLGIGAIKPDVAARIEESGLLYNPFTGSPADFARSRHPLVGTSIPEVLGLNYVYVRANPTARFGTMQRLENPSWSVEYLAGHLDLARRAREWPMAASKVDKASSLAMQAMYIYHYNVDNFGGFGQEASPAYSQWIRVRGFIPQMPPILYASFFGP